MIAIYGAKNCGYCTKAIQLASELQMDTMYFDVHESGNGEKLRSRIPDAKTVPQIFWNDEYIGGFTEFEERFGSEVVYNGVNTMNESQTEFLDKMGDGRIHEIVFTKTNGEVRVMNANLGESFPTHIIVEEEGRVKRINWNQITSLDGEIFDYGSE